MVSNLLITLKKTKSKQCVSIFLFDANRICNYEKETHKI